MDSIIYVSVTIIIGSDGDITSLKQQDGWKPTTVTQEYIDESVTNKMQIADKIWNLSLSNNTAEQKITDLKV